jgi:arsenate reductase-like glutaredoxin family protein
LRDELGLELDERDYAKTPLSAAELAEIFANRDPRDFLNPKSPAFKATGLAGKKLTPEQAIKLMAQDSRLIKRPLVIAGRKIVAGFDREQLRKTLS